MQNSYNFTETLPDKPRKIDPQATFHALVAWIEDLAIKKNAPGLIVGISGTDSILTFLACAKAFENIGRPDRVMGIHYGRPFPPPDKTADEVARILKLTPSFNWVSRTIVPWLRQQAPGAVLTVDNSIDYHDDHARWAALYKSSLNGAERTQPLPPGQGYWPVGTRNATEQALGTYSNISGAVSLQPIIHLWKSEILALCHHLDVPKLAIEKSRQVDCDCGRFDLAADHIEEVDMILMARNGVLSPNYLKNNIDVDLQQRLENFVDEQTGYAGFKKEIPYCPPRIIVAPQ